MDICQRVTKVVSPRRLCDGLVGPHLRGGRYPGGSSVPLAMPFSAGGSEIRLYRIRVVRWVGRAASPRRPLSRWELSFPSSLPRVLFSQFTKFVRKVRLEIQKIREQ